MKRVDGKIAIVTGGASGIGRALASELAARGGVVVLADRQQALAEEAASGIQAAGGSASARELDVRDFEAFRRLVDETKTRHGRVDYLFNNAGIAVGGEMDRYKLEDWTDVFDVNLRGVSNGVQAVYPTMIAQGSGHIVNTASMAGLVPAPGEGSYTATKHAVVGLTKALRVEGKRHGVRASALCPGAIRTPILTGGRYGRLGVVLEGVSKEKIMQVWERVRPMPVDKFARRAIDAVLRNDAIIVLPGWWKALWYLDRLSPSLSMRLWETALGRLRNELEQA
jgi:NAD(P)-dependent dehydrogenase (short-subunit alcohol dehydrogenase family)